MHEFFHGWRRKAGLAVLVTACVLMAMWNRSLFYKDTVQLHIADKAMSVMVSNRSWVYWQTVRERPSFPGQSAESKEYSAAIEYETLYFSESIDAYSYFETVSTPHFSFVVHGPKSNFDGITMTAWGIPYWLMILSISVLSAYLILWTPRKRVDNPV